MNSFESAARSNQPGLSATPSRQRIFTCNPKVPPEEQACATKIISTIAHRAYRRPVSEDDMRGLFAFYEAGRRRGDFDEGIRSALTRILASPYFLYRATPAEPANKIAEATYRVRDLDLASRLSFFCGRACPMTNC